MPSYNPPTRGVAFVFRMSLEDYTTSGRFKINPTIAAGEFQVDKDGAGLNNLTLLPTVEPVGSQLVKVSLSATEMTADVVTIVARDASVPPEWCDVTLTILTTPP